MEKIYDDAIERLSQDRESLKDQLEMYGYFNPEIDFLRMLDNGELKDIRGEMIFNILGHLNETNHIHVDEKTVKNFWKAKS